MPSSPESEVTIVVIDWSPARSFSGSSTPSLPLTKSSSTSVERSTIGSMPIPNS